MKTMTDVTLSIQKQLGRPDTLRLLAKAGKASRASKNEFTPAAILVFMEHRIEQGFTTDKLVAMPNGRMIQQARKFLQRANG